MMNSEIHAASVKIGLDWANNAEFRQYAVEDVTDNAIKHGYDGEIAAQAFRTELTKQLEAQRELEAVPDAEYN